MPERFRPSPPLALLGAAALILLTMPAAEAEGPARRRVAQAAPESGGALLVPSPERAVELALARAPILRSAEAGRRAAQGDRVTAGLRPNPEFSVEAENIGGSGGYGGIRSLETTYGLSQRIETGGKRQARIEAAGRAVALTGLDVEAVRLDLAREVVQALAAAVARARAVDIARERQRLADEVLRATRARVEAGREAPVQQRRAEVDRETATVFLDRAEREAASAARGLAVLLAAPAVEVAPARAAWFDEIGPRPEPGRAAALPPGQLDRARLDALIGQRRAELDLQRRNAIPDIAVGAGMRRFREAGGDTAFLLGLRVPLPVFDRNQGNILRAGAELNRAEAEAERGRLYLDASLAESERRLDQAWRAADSLRRTVLPAAREAAGAAREGYAAGKFSLLEVLDAQRVLIDAREQLNGALLEVQQVRADIVRLRGRAAEPAGRPTP
ncbi:TolC family protein [Belnapia rosea]|uniref:TolC family protein n=1 Tax=Belnapia rosea TaxID=938405 RepID=UPI000891C848|nr:TolC family protein [Belnapia rosea]SDB35108.1 outer membrane protein, cobalt-zinc-cadmium efflux system [Belnapia rosea]